MGIDSFSPVYFSNEETGDSGWAVVSQNTNNYSFVFQPTSSCYLEISTLFGTFGLTAWKSDIRDKENISDSEISAVEVIGEIKHRRFRWKNVVDGLGEEHEGAWVDCGFVAQELQQVEPSFVFAVAEGTSRERLQISEPNIIPYLTKAIQELASRVEELERVVFGGNE